MRDLVALGSRGDYFLISTCFELLSYSTTEKNSVPCAFSSNRAAVSSASFLILAYRSFSLSPRDLIFSDFDSSAALVIVST